MSRAGTWRLGCNGASSTRPVSRPGKDCNPRTAGPRPPVCRLHFGREEVLEPLYAAFDRPGRHGPECRGSWSSIACHFRLKRAPEVDPGRSVFLPWRRVQHGSPKGPWLGEIARAPCARPSCQPHGHVSVTEGRENRAHRSGKTRRRAQSPRIPVFTAGL